MDAQWFGVAQRRRRVFVVGCFGDAASAAKVLFESESVQRNPTPCRTPREKTSGPIAGCSNGCGANGPGRTADDADSLVVAHMPVMVMAHGQANAEICEGYSPTLSCAHEVPIAFAQHTRDEVRLVGGDGSIVGALAAHPGMKQTTCVAFKESQSGCRVGDVHATLDANNGSRRMQGVMPAVAIRTAQTSANGHGIAEEVCHTIDQAQGQAVAFATDLYNGAIDGDVSHSIRVGNGNAMGGVPSALVNVFSDSINSASTDLIAFTAKGSGADAGPLCPTIRAGGHSKSHANGGVMPAVAHTLKGRGFDGSEDGTGRGTPLVPLATAVRRLTPRECERLQGFPDFYTAITYRKKPAADGPRYKALGNSMAVPCMRWIGERIEALGRRGSGG